MFRLYTMTPDYTLSGWQWKKDNDVNAFWHDYPKAVSDEIDKNDGSGYMWTNSQGFTYIIYKKTLTQTNPYRDWESWSIRYISPSASASGGKGGGGSSSSGVSKKRSGGGGAGASKSRVSRKKTRTKRGPTGEDLTGFFPFVYIDDIDWATITNWRRVYPGTANPSDRAFKDGWSFKAGDDIPEEYLKYGLGLEPGEDGAPDFAQDPDWSADDYDYGALVELTCSTVAKPCIFHQRFISRTLDSTSTCPSCSQKYNPPGPQPSGSLAIRWIRSSCSGYDSVGTWELSINIPSGIQGKRHQNPGNTYDGTNRIAYYPNVYEGRNAVQLIKYAFERGKAFKIGQSITSGNDNQTIWGGIHMKTSLDAPYGWRGVTADKVFQNVYSEFVKVFNAAPEDLGIILESI